MNILHISTYDKGGAFNAMMQLHKSLITNNINSKVLVLYKTSSDPTVYPFICDKTYNVLVSIKYRIINAYKNILIKLFHLQGLEFTYPFSVFDVTKHPLYKNSDIIHIHWSGNFLDVKSFKKRNMKPVIITLHDENIFLGGFHYTFDKKNSSDKSKKLDDKFIKFKKRYLYKVDYYVAPSKWLYSILINHNYISKLIPYGIDGRSFKSYDKNEARKMLNLDLEKRIYLLLADNLMSKRKGIKEFMEVFLKNCRQNELLLIVGKKINIPLPQNCIQYGFIKDTSTLSKLYSCSDFFINPTLADNLPNTVLESLSCGTPVAGFNIGGMPDMINESNGILVNEGDFKALLVEIRLQTNTYNRLAIRNSILKTFSLEKQASVYTQLYKSIINNSL